MTVEPTLIRRMQLAPGTDWVWMPELNIVGVSADLDDAGVEAALNDVQVQWRRKLMRMVPPSEMTA